MISVRLILTISKIQNLDSKSIDSVLTFPQADLEVEIWIQLPIFFQVDGQNEEDLDI